MPSKATIKRDGAYVVVIGHDGKEVFRRASDRQTAGLAHLIYMYEKYRKDDD